MDNSVASTEFLLASLDTELTRRVKRLLEFGNSFTAVWLCLIDVLVSISSRHHDDIHEKGRRCSLADYAQENIETMIDDMKISFKELICTNQFNVSLLYLSEQNLRKVYPDRNFQAQSFWKNARSQQRTPSVCLHV